jgi:hypothetical protein
LDILDKIFCTGTDDSRLIFTGSAFREDLLEIFFKIPANERFLPPPASEHRTE